MHEIDDDSPLAGLDWNDPDNLIAIIDYGRFHDTEPEDESRDTSADDARDDAEPADS